MNKNNPLVSVIIPAYNAEKYILEAIDSVLEQNYRPLEIIVVDDGSTDKTAEKIEQYSSWVKYIYQENSGSAVARNNGINQAKGEYLAFLDADDIWLKDKLKNQLKVFDENSKIDLVFGLVQQFFSPDLDEATKNKIYCNPEPMIGCIPSAMIIRRSAFEIVGKFTSQWKIAEFADWYARAKESNIKMIHLPIVVTKRRLHQDNKGIKNKQQANLDYVRMIKASLDRRRGKNN